MVRWLKPNIEDNKVRTINTNEIRKLVCELFIKANYKLPKDIFEKIKGSRVVLLESNYDLFMLEAGSYPYDLKCRIKGECGHLCNDDAALVVKRLVENGTKEIILGHLSQENNYPDLAFETTKLCLLGHGIKVGEDVLLSVAKRDGVVLSHE